MTKNPFDQFSKQFFETFLSPYGQIKISEEVPGEPTLIDIYFSPTVKVTQIPQSLGLLRRIASTPCLLEPYRNQPSIHDDIESCINKLFAVRAEYIRDLKGNDKAYSAMRISKAMDNCTFIIRKTTQALWRQTSQ